MENVFLTVQTVIWDWPLLIWMHVCSLVGFRALSPFISILDDDIGEYGSREMCTMGYAQCALPRVLFELYYVFHHVSPSCPSMSRIS